MNISRLRIVYVVSLVVLGVLVVLTVLRPMITGGEYSEVQREQLLQTEEEWIIQFDIINHEGEDRNYAINVSVDGRPSTLTVSIPDERAFTYIKHIRQDMLANGVASFAIYKVSEDTSFEQVIYHLK